MYNTWIARGARQSHETLMRNDDLYDFVVMTDHNQKPRQRGMGSAIFIHVARAQMTPTAGCLAFAKAQWQRGVVPDGTYLVGMDPRPIR